MVQAIKSLGETKMVELAVQEENRKGTTQISIMSNYGLTHNQVYKAITGVPRPGGSQYGTMKKELKTEGVKEESIRKTPKRQRGKAVTKYKSLNTKTITSKILFRTTKTSKRENTLLKAMPPFSQHKLPIKATINAII